ncbi:MAG: metal ABC transporter permease [Acidobacteriota bacterium]|nr:metal ABC transporter permease [Acidobacteriota bacterium]
MHRLLTWLVEPGFASSAPVHVALVVGTVAATVSAVVGVFTVLRGQSFAGHALTDVAAAGGSGALLLGAGALSGFVVGGLLGAGAMDLVGVQRARGRDLATGVVLGVATGVTALVLYLDTTTRATAGTVQQVLFGSIFSVDAAVVPVSVALGAVAVAAVGALYRPLLLSSVDPELAAARGVPTRAVGVVFMGALSLAVGLSAVAIGAILSTALLVGPAAAALRATRRLGWAVVTAVVIGTVSTSLGVLFAYDSYYWAPGRRGLPVSFFVVALVVAAYGVSGLPARRRRRVPGTGR